MDRKLFLQMKRTNKLFEGQQDIVQITISKQLS